QPGVHPTFARDHEYKRHGTLSLLAGIDLLTGKVHALVRDRHRSREFVEFLKLLDLTYPAHTAIKLILDNHSAHISRQTKAWLATRPRGRFKFTFTPKHGSWLNLIEGFFSKFARSVLRHIRVASKQELKERIMAGVKDVNRHPVIHTRSYKLAKAARYDSNQENHHVTQSGLLNAQFLFCVLQRKELVFRRRRVAPFQSTKGNGHVESQKPHDGRGRRSPHARNVRFRSILRASAPEGRPGGAALRASARAG